MHESAEQNAINTGILERQIFSVALDQIQSWMLAPAQCNQFGADVEPDAGVAAAAQQLGEYARAATKIRNPRAFWQAAQPDEGRYQPFIGLRREYLRPRTHDMFVRNRGRGAHGAVLTGFSASEAPFVLVYPADDDYNAGMLDAMVTEAGKG